MPYQLPPSLPSQGNRCSRWFFRSLFKGCGWHLEGELPDQPKGVIAFAPHTSNWDFPIAICIVLALGLRIRYLGKDSLFKPYWGWLFRGLGGIPIDRSQANGVVGQMTEAFASHEKLLLAVAPEGTRSQVSQWKTGFLHIAKAADVPVLVATMNYQTKTITIGQQYQIDDVKQSLATIQHDVAALSQQSV
jgi:1-acyl-sn-glycerol-3-phosphate acyltransferase